MKPRLWVVSELFYPDAQATSRILTSLAEGLASSFDVRVVSAHPTTQFEPRVDVPATEDRNGVHIRRFVSTRLDKAVLAYRIVNLLTISVPIFIHLLLHLRKSDQVLVVTNPPVMPFVAVVAAAVSGARCVILTHDVYPDVLIPTGIMNDQDVLYRFLRRLTRWMMRHVAGIVVLGRDMEELVRTYLDSKRTPVVIIPNWAEPERISPQPRSKNRILAELGALDKFVILHAGTMGRIHGIEWIVEGARRCLDRARVHFIFAGTGVKRVVVESAVDRDHLANVSLLPFLDATEQNELLNACDVAVISTIPGMYGISIPSRMYNTMAAGKPIIGITEAGSELARVIEEERVGWIVAPGDIDALLRSIDQAMQDPERVADMGRRARRAAETRYTPQASISAFRSFLGEARLR